MKGSQNIIFILVGLVVSLWALTSVLTGQGNSVAAFAKYIAFATIVMGFFGKKLPFYVLLFSAAYSDLLKRFLIVDGRFGYDDIAIILAISPCLMATLAINNFIRYIFNAKSYGRWPIIALIYGVINTVNAGFQAMGSGGQMMTVLQYGANIASYSFLPFCFLVSFRNFPELLSFLKKGLYIFIPVAVWGMKQSFFKYTDTELNYLSSNMSSVGSENILNLEATRPFSTVASPGSFAFSCGFFAAVALFFILNRKKIGSDPQLKHLAPNALGMSLLALIFIGGLIVSKSRTQMIVGLGILPMAFMFRYQILTASAYAGLVALTVLLFSFSGYILDHDLIDRYQEGIVTNVVEKTGIDDRYVLLSTLHARLEGFRNFVENPEFRTLFGSEKFADLQKTGDVRMLRDAGMGNHDLITGSALRFGLVPTSAFLIVFSGFLFWLHRSLFRMKDRPLVFSFGRLGLAVFIMSYTGAAFAGGSLMANPVPLIINIGSGATLWSLWMMSEWKRTEALKKRVAKESQPNMRAARNLLTT